MAALTGDVTDANRAFSVIQSHLTDDYYLPELVVNSSMGVITKKLADSNTITSNALVELEHNSSASSSFSQLEFGTNFTGAETLGYLGAYRIYADNSNHYANETRVLVNGNTSIEESNFTINGDNFTLFLNATIQTGAPYINYSLQFEALNSQLPPTGSTMDLQVFSNSGQFANATVYNSTGSFLSKLPFNGASNAATQNGMIISYQRNQSVFTQDAVAMTFNASKYGATIEDHEHWYKNGGEFQNLSWMGLAFKVPPTPVGQISTAIQGQIFPIGNADYRMINQTAEFISTNPTNEAVGPPVSFGFISYGLALYAESNPAYLNLAQDYWNYYYNLYNNSDYPSVYSNSINVFALAGLKLFSNSSNPNNTVDNFVRRFVNNTTTGNTSIEENGWAVAGMCDLAKITNNLADEQLCSDFMNSFALSGTQYLVVRGSSATSNGTFQFGEAASGLMLGGVNYNKSIVLAAMSAVFQAENVSGVLNTPALNADLGNTEAIPAALLSEYLFNGNMFNATGYSITSLHNANLSSIDYSNGALVIRYKADASGGNLTLNNNYTSFNYALIAGSHAIKIFPTSLKLSCAPKPGTENEVSTCTAKVTSSHHFPSNESVNFALFQRGTPINGNEVCSASGRKLTCAITFTPTEHGRIIVTATYSGDKFNAASEREINYKVS